MEGRAQAQRCAALGASGLGRGAPGKGIEMRPVDVFAHELVEEQARHAGAGKAV